MRSRVRELLRRLFTLDDTPERIALAFSLGVFLAFSPLIGLHAFLGFILAFSLSINRVAFLLGLFVNNPWTLVPIYAAGTYLGRLLMGSPSGPHFPSFEWRSLWDGSFWLQLVRQWHIIKPLLLGSTILSVFAAILAYWITLRAIRQRRAHLGKLQIEIKG